jgi:3-oxoadipate enol-lactonase
VIAELARDFRVIAYDLRGSGASETTPGPYSIDLLVDDLDGLLGELDLGPVALVGHSLGGGIVLGEAARHPDRVRAVVGVGAVTSLPDAGRDAMHARAETVEEGGMAAVAETVATNGLAPSFREAHPEELQELISLLASAGVAGYAAQCRALAAMNINGELGQIEAPTLLVAGELDQVSTIDANEAHEAAIPGADLAVIPDCAHIIPWEKPEEVLATARMLLSAT